MGRKEHIYSRIPDAEEIVKKLCEKYPDVMWAVRPETISCYGIENKERPKSSNIMAKIKSVKGSEKAIFQENNIKTRYIIEMYWSDYNEWTEKMKQYVLFHELLHVHPEFGRVVKHDTEDFSILLDAVGVKWFDKVNDLPDLLIGDVKFNLDLRPNLETEEDDEKSEVDDVLDEISKEKETKKE